MTDIYKTWATFGIDGFRIDTMKHVNMEFWQEFTPKVLAAAKAGGTPDFFMFGEVYDSDPKILSSYTTTGTVQATLDFGFQSAALGFAQSKGTTSIRDFFASDDWYTDADSNAYQLPTFLGNHDMGRVAMMLKGAGYAGDELLARDKLAHSLMYVTRGQPVVYYGDEQGFIGAGGDKDSRQDMFATKVAQYAAEPLVGGGTMGSQDRYSLAGPMATHIASLAKLRSTYPALADGAQVHRYASAQDGIYAFSRMLAADGIEYLVVANNSTQPKTATFSTYSPRMRFKGIYGASGDLKTGADSRVSVSVAPLSVSVYRAVTAVGKTAEAPTVTMLTPAPGAVVGGRTEVSAAVRGSGPIQVSFAYRMVGSDDWHYIGTDDNAPYRVFHDTSALAKGTLVEYRAVAKDRSGRLGAASASGLVGTPKPVSGGGDGGPSGPVVQPDAVSVPGTHNSAMGCGGDWQPACDQAQLTLDPKDLIWKKTFDSIPAGDYLFKAAINKGWDENYGQNATMNGANIPYTATGKPVTFYYDHQTHHVANDAQGPIITAPGSYQEELGCGGDWKPDCMRPWLQDPDGDGTYTWSTTQIPAGNYDMKVAHGLAWGEDYGLGGVKGGPNVPVSVPADGVVVTISYVLATHQITVSTSTAGAAPDLKAAKAIWVSPDLIAWPADAVPSALRDRLDTLSWRLHASPAGGLALDAESLTGGTAYDLRYDSAGLPASVVVAHPELTGYLALRLDAKTAKAARDVLRGQVAVALYDENSRLLDATGVQTAYVLDALYASTAQRRTYGVTFSGQKPTFRLWAPTAQSVTLLTWPAGSAANAPTSAATRTAMTRMSDGGWSASGRSEWKNARYLYEVKVFAPSTGKVETNLVTDPYSVALTLNSTKSVAVDLADPAWAPKMWASTAAPKLAKTVDQTIYELHIRDFSVNDQSVPAEQRGSYLAFAGQGQGVQHLRELAKAGLNTVHLLPSFDIASIEEDPAKQKSPQCDLPSLPPDSAEQQKCVKAVSADDAFNWGYDPWHFSAPEGSYASTPAAADGGARVAEFRSMVGGLHASGLRVVLDQVFNHTAASGQADKSVLDKIVPGYYHRLDAKGAVTTSTCCQNTATEHAMMERLMVDSLVVWAKHYKVDGFRFDLMGHHSVETMKAARAALDGLTLKRDGVDGKAITLYGEGWNFGEVADNARFTQATQGQLGGTSIATFSDRLRDAVRGGGPFDDDPRKQGFGSGQATDPNGSPINGDAAAQRETLAYQTDLVQLGLAGNLRSFTFTSSSSGKAVRGDELKYGEVPAGYADQPDEVISYVDAHDNETLFDSLTMKLPPATAMSEKVRMNTLSLATVALAQTPAFWHAGADLLRSKSLDRNSYDSGDWFNVLDFSKQDNGFGRGLPPAADNEAKWQYMKPLLADPKNKPSAADIASASAAAQDLLKLRFSTPLFRLGSAEAIKAKVSFPVSGTAEAKPGVIVMHLDDTVGSQVDAKNARVVVVFNAGTTPVDQVVPGLSGPLALSPVQTAGSDAVVKQSTWDAATSTAHVPARTVAVFVQPRA